MMRGACQPLSKVQSMATMWSVKCFPKPGFDKIFSRSLLEVERVEVSVLNSLEEKWVEVKTIPFKSFGFTLGYYEY